MLEPLIDLESGKRGSIELTEYGATPHNPLIVPITTKEKQKTAF
jgi:hypothetical protein